MTKIGVRLSDTAEDSHSPIKEKRFREFENSLDSPDTEEPRIPTPRTVTPNLPEIPDESPRRRRKFSVPSEDELAGFVNLRLGQADTAYPSYPQDPTPTPTPVFVSHANDSTAQTTNNHDDTVVFANMAPRHNDPLKQYLSKGRRVPSFFIRDSFRRKKVFFFFQKPSLTFFRVRVFPV